MSVTSLSAQRTLYQPACKVTGKVRIKRFCIDNEKERTEYEELALKHAEGIIRFLKEPESIFSQKSDKYYLVVTWMEQS